MINVESEGAWKAVRVGAAGVLGVVGGLGLAPDAGKLINQLNPTRPGNSAQDPEFSTRNIANAQAVDSQGIIYRVFLPSTIRNAPPIKPAVTEGTPVPATVTPKPENTRTPTPTSTDTRTATATSTSTSTKTATATNTATSTSTSTRTASPTPSPTSTATELPTRTSTATATATRTATATNTATPTIELGPVKLNYDIGPGVVVTDVNIIKSGISLGQSELQSRYGGDIRRPVNNPLTVKIVSGSTAELADGCCQALNESGAQPYFNVGHDLWLNMYLGNLGREMASGHEYVHAWQNSLGCLTLHDQPLPDWLYEGEAEFIPHQQKIAKGELDNQVTRYFYYASAKGTGQLGASLESQEHPPHFTWPGHVGYLATERLAQQAPSGILSLRKVCEQISLGSSVDQAFQTAFGQTRADFYAAFPAYIDSLAKSPVYLSLVGALPGGGNPNRREYKFNFAAYGYEDLTSEQKFAAWGLPQEMCGWGSELLGEVNIALCDAKPGKYPITLRLPDGRQAQVEVTYPPVS